jgi:hypothetical protein
VSEFPLFIEKPAGLGPLEHFRTDLRKMSERSLHEVKMMLVLIQPLSLTRLKQKIRGEHLEHHTSQGPHIRIAIKRHAEDDLG